MKDNFCISIDSLYNHINREIKLTGYINESVVLIFED